MRILLLPFISSFFFSFFFVCPLFSQTSHPFIYQFTFTITSERWNNPLSGIKSDGSYLGLANINGTSDTQEAKAWQSGAFYINHANINNSVTSKDLSGVMFNQDITPSLELTNPFFDKKSASYQENL
jgi:hypothetical protein